jgi:hypothetical protein
LNKFYFLVILFHFFKLLDKRAIQELIKEVDPLMQIDEEVEDVYILIKNFVLFLSIFFSIRC